MSVSSSSSTSSNVSSLFSNKLDNLFSKSDSDSDGKLSFSEFMAAGQNMPGVKPPGGPKNGKNDKTGGQNDLLQQLMAILDKTGTESPSSAAADASSLKDKADDVKNRAIKDLFAALDSIRDQNSTSQSKAGKEQGKATSREDLFKAIDTDKDGSLTRDEARTFQEQKINEARAAILQVQELFNTTMPG